MIRRKDECECSVREQMRGGEGEVQIKKLWDPETELKANNRLFAKLVLNPGSSIGFHRHDNEEEVFFVIRGAAEADDDGNTVTLNPGDTILTGNGSGHSIKSVGSEPLELLAVISCYD
ncbi:MAG: cupin domain-containing protein [Victivallales bacterium]|nr:cupin domain-containing protein [Victivallales bacterium]